MQPLRSDRVGPFTATPSWLPPDEWSVILINRPNVLIEGPAAATEAALRALMPHCDEPLNWWGVGRPVRWPATLIVNNVAELDANDQRFLYHWLNVPVRRTQVISVTSLPLFPLVERGLFLAALYYRLNVVRLDVDMSERPAG